MMQEVCMYACFVGYLGNMPYDLYVCLQCVAAQWAAAKVQSDARSLTVSNKCCEQYQGVGFREMNI